MKAFAFLLTVLLFSFNSIAQNAKQFSGLLLDKGTGMPIVWAHIAIKDSGIGTVSNTQGRFLLNVPIGGTSIPVIVISCIGYRSRSIVLPLEASPELKIFLEADIKLLNEVVIKPPDIRQLILEAITFGN